MLCERTGKTAIATECSNGACIASSEPFLPQIVHTLQIMHAEETRCQKAITFAWMQNVATLLFCCFFVAASVVFAYR